MAIAFIKAAWEHFQGTIVYLYRHSRPQFHPALYVLLNAALLSVTLWMLDFAFALVMDDPSRHDFHLMLMFTGILGTGELVRGHVRSMIECPPERWSAVAAAVGGVAAGLVMWAASVGSTGALNWNELLPSLCFGVGAYLALGWLIEQAAKCEAKKQNGA